MDTDLEIKKQKMLASLREQMKNPPSAHPDEPFYETRAWQDVRYRAILKSKGMCAACGESRYPFHVDHIKPRSKYPELKLDENNLQVLCEDCNIGKSNWDETDWRK